MVGKMVFLIVSVKENGGRENGILVVASCSSSVVGYMLDINVEVSVSVVVGISSSSVTVLMMEGSIVMTIVVKGSSSEVNGYSSPVTVDDSLFVVRSDKE